MFNIFLAKLTFEADAVSLRDLKAFGLALDLKHLGLALEHYARCSFAPSSRGAFNYSFAVLVH